MVTALAGGLIAFATPGAAYADDTAALASPNSSPSLATPNATQPPPSVTPAPSPTITSPQANIFIGSGTTTVSGTREINQEIQLLSPTGGDPMCIVATNGTTAWSCTNVRLPSGPTVTLRAVVTGDATLSDEVTVAVLSAPTVTGGSSGQAASDGNVRGTGYPGASVTALLSSGLECTSTADSSGAWSCLFGEQLASGSREVTASQKTGFSAPSSSNASAPVTIVFDLEKPAAPSLTSPVNGAQVPVEGTSYSGNGENGAIVTVYAGAYSVCSAVVTNSAWSCSAGGVAAGSYSVIVAQQDAAGNFSAGSPPHTVTYVTPSTPDPPQPAPGEGSQAGPAVPAPTTPSPSSSEAAPTPSATPRPSAPGQDEASDAAAGRVPGGWNDPTQFTAAVAPPGSSEQFPWLQAVLLALGAVLLIAIPARLLAGTISIARGGRPLWSGTPISGRNRAREEFETAPAVHLNQWFVGGAALIAAAALVMLSGPVIDQPAYLRLLLAVSIALVVVNTAGTIVPLWWSTRVLRVEASVTFLPRYLVLVAVTALGSRLLEIHPALLFGLLGSVAVAAGPTAARRGQLGAVRAASLIVLAVVGWLILGTLPSADGLLSALGAEIANTVVLGAISSAVIVLIPIGNTSGRSILAWSPLIWTGLTVLAFTILFAVLSPVVDLWQGEGTVTLLWVTAGAFAALSVGAWAWQRFVAPTLH